MSKVQQALRHVNAHFPQVDRVHIDIDGQWSFSDANGDAPSFEGKPIDTSLLEDAVDEAWGQVPATFVLEKQ